MNILSILKCKCGVSDLVKKKNLLSCSNCNQKYPINKGIFNFLEKTSEIVSTEIEENKELQKQRQDKDDTWILNLPLVEDFGNIKFSKVNEGYFENFRWVLNNMDLKNKIVLDLGAGTCWTTNMLAKKGAECVAVDISVEKFVGLESAEVYFKYDKTFFDRVLSDMDVLPFINNSFDIVFANAAMHHATNLKKTLAEIKRVLKPNGLFVATNEPCSGILNFSKKVNPKRAQKAGMHIPKGWNERIYSLYNYWGVLKQNDLSPRFIIPPSTKILLKNVEFVKSYKKWIGKIAVHFLDYKLFKKMYWIGAFIFGAPLIIIAEKKC